MLVHGHINEKDCNYLANYYGKPFASITEGLKKLFSVPTLHPIERVEDKAYDWKMQRFALGQGNDVWDRNAEELYK
jgi:hypothetical protein